MTIDFRYLDAYGLHKAYRFFLLTGLVSRKFVGQWSTSASISEREEPRIIE